MHLEDVPSLYDSHDAIAKALTDDGVPDMLADALASWALCGFRHASDEARAIETQVRRTLDEANEQFQQAWIDARRAGPEPDGCE
jgi:hypothetical protein